MIRVHRTEAEPGYHLDVGLSVGPDKVHVNFSRVEVEGKPVCKYGTVTLDYHPEDISHYLKGYIAYDNEKEDHVFYVDIIPDDGSRPPHNFNTDENLDLVYYVVSVHVPPMCEELSSLDWHLWSVC